MKRIIGFICVLVMLLGTLFTAVPASAAGYTVITQKDVLYGQGKSYEDESPVDLYMDVYSPKELADTPSPAVIFIHGGGFGGNDKDFTLFRTMCTEFAKAGYVAFTINYVLYPDQAYVDLAEDIRAHATDDAETALKHIRDNAQSYGVDPDKILACGDSAGAAIAVALAYDNRCASKLAGVIDLWGGMSSFVEETRNDPNSWSKDIYKYSIKVNPTPCLIVHGDGDTVAPISVSYDFKTKLEKKNGVCDMYVVEGANHYPEDRAGEFIPQMLAFTRKVTSLKVNVQKDIVYGQSEDYYETMADLKMDVYTPDNDETNRPAIMFIHGGGFNGSDKAFDLFVKMSTEFAQRGYVAFSINYSGYPGQPYVNVVEDLRQHAVAEARIALKHIKDNAETYGIASDRIVVCGDSAGAAIAVALALDNDCESDFAGLISLWGGMSSFTEETTDPTNTWSNPIYDFPVKNNPTPTLLIHGSADDIAPATNSFVLKSKLDAAGGDTTMYIINGAAHYPEKRIYEFIFPMFDFADKVTRDYKVTSMDGDREMGVVNVRYNTALADITFATDGESVVEGWYSDAELTKPLDLEEGILRDDLTVYAAVKAPEYILGDANGDKGITILDALSIFKFISGKEPLEGNAFLAADVDGNGNVQITDALQIFKYLAGKITDFNV